MTPAVEKFLQLRPRLKEVRDDEHGWILADLDYDPIEAGITAVLTELHNQGVIAEVRRGTELVFPLALGGAGLLHLRIDTGNIPGYFETFDSLITNHPEAPPADFVVWERSEGLHSGYKAACSFLEFLKSKAEVWDSTAQRFFLVDQQAIEIPFRSYTARQTVAVPGHLSGVTRFLDAQHLDADVRWAFFRKAALRFLRDVLKERRLGVLLENLGSVFEQAAQDYSLYLERFSFEDLLKNFDEKRLKFVGDLNHILASIQTSLIAVPIGFFLVAEKFRPTSGFMGQNIVLAAGGLLFFGLLFVLSLNQGATLNGVKLALLEFEAEQKKKVTEKSERLQSLLQTTWSQFHRVRWFLWIVRALLLLFVALIFAAFLWTSNARWQALLPYLKD